jgi:GDP-4-dehydro-6-deoxy-D-mannose reductase
MKYLITGISGFVGAHLLDHLLPQGHEVVGVDMHPLAIIPSGAQFRQISLMDERAIRALIDEVKPERIIHLASASSVAASWKAPIDCFVNNTNIFLNLVEAVRSSGIRCRILSVGSSEEYGPVAAKDVPLKEDRPADPMNPYAVARVAQEQLSRVFAKGYGMDIVCTRSFNHVGPGQTDRFVISSFVRQAVEVKKGLRKEIVCGELGIVRDLIDVRDVVRSYGTILDKGISGEIYNVCRAQGVSLKDVLAKICAKAGVPFVFRVDPALIRPIDNPVIIGDNAKLRGLGFTPSYELDVSLDEMVIWWMSRIK